MSLTVEIKSTADRNKVNHSVGIQGGTTVKCLLNRTTE